MFNIFIWHVPCTIGLYMKCVDLVMSSSKQGKLLAKMVSKTIQIKALGILGTSLEWQSSTEYTMGLHFLITYLNHGTCTRRVLIQDDLNDKYIQKRLSWVTFGRPRDINLITKWPAFSLATIAIAEGSETGSTTTRVFLGQHWAAKGSATQN